MPSFDVVSKVNSNEVDNALLQAQKEVGTRFDFRDTDTTIERTADGIVLVSSSEGRLEATLEVVRTKLVRRQVSLKHIDPQTPQPAARSSFRQLVKIKEGIDRDNARKVIDLVKSSKIRVTAAIHDDTVRITGKNRDDLQAVIKLLRAEDLPFEVQCVNFRE